MKQKNFPSTDIYMEKVAGFPGHHKNLKNLHTLLDKLTIGLLVATIIIWICFWILQLPVQRMLSVLVGTNAALAFQVAYATICSRIIILAVLGFAVNLLLILFNRNGLKIPYYITWGALCVIGVFMCSIVNSEHMLAHRNVPEEIITYAFSGVRALGIAYGVGIPVLQAAFYLNFCKPIAILSSVLTMVTFLAVAVCGVWLGVSVLQWGISGSIFLSFGSILAFILSMILNRGKTL